MTPINPCPRCGDFFTAKDPHTEANGACPPCLQNLEDKASQLSGFQRICLALVIIAIGTTSFSHYLETHMAFVKGAPDVWLSLHIKGLLLSFQVAFCIDLGLTWWLSRKSPAQVPSPN